MVTLIRAMQLKTRHYSNEFSASSAPLRFAFAEPRLVYKSISTNAIAKKQPSFLALKELICGNKMPQHILTHIRCP